MAATLTVVFESPGFKVKVSEQLHRCYDDLMWNEIVAAIRGPALSSIISIQGKPDEQCSFEVQFEKRTYEVKVSATATCIQGTVADLPNAGKVLELGKRFGISRTSRASSVRMLIIIQSVVAIGSA